MSDPGSSRTRAPQQLSLGFCPRLRWAYTSPRPPDYPTTLLLVHLPLNFSAQTASGAIWPVWSGSHTSVAVAIGSRPMSVASFSTLHPKVKHLFQVVRWPPGIEYDHHRVLDIAFGEDDNRIRAGQAPAHNLLPQDWSLSKWVSQTIGWPQAQSNLASNCPVPQAASASCRCIIPRISNRSKVSGSAKLASTMPCHSGCAGTERGQSAGAARTTTVAETRSQPPMPGQTTRGRQARPGPGRCCGDDSGRVHSRPSVRCGIHGIGKESCRGPLPTTNDPQTWPAHCAKG